MTHFTRRGLLIYPVDGLTPTIKDTIAQSFVDILQLETFADESKMWDGNANFSDDYGATGTHKAISFVCTPALASAISDAMQSADGLWYLLDHNGALLDTNDSTKLDNGNVTHGLQWEPDIDVTVGEVLQFNGRVVEVVQSHTTQADWAPDIAVALFKPYIQPGTAPQWRQPLGSFDAYPIGARVTFNGEIYISTLDANVWAPDVTGWQLENGGGDPDAWAAGVSYTVGDIVTYNGSQYECLQSHTSQVGWEPPNVPALWLAL